MYWCFEHVFVPDVLSYVPYSHLFILILHNTCIKKDNSKLTYKLAFHSWHSTVYRGNTGDYKSLLAVRVCKSLVSKYEIPVKSTYM